MKFRRFLEKYAGVVGVGIFVIAVGLIVLLGYRSFSYTISNITSQSVAAQVCFGVFGCIASLLIGYSLLAYIPQKWGLGLGWRILAWLVAVAFFVTCFFPNDPDATNMHDYGSWAMAGFSLISVGFLLFRLWGRYGVRLRVANGVLFGAMLFVAVIILTQYAFFRKYVLFFECGFVLSFFIFMLFLIFDKPRRK